ncbi:MAG: PD-(D/E)XK nuclease family protein [Candidatus Margulisbacteria bacterium]|nr:PD-(D/E)XK nuclease family protein [Candidatus Margulisiibacteriota bacterium]
MTDKDTLLTIGSQFASGKPVRKRVLPKATSSLLPFKLKAYHFPSHGLLNGVHTKRILKNKYMLSSFSATQLEKYQSCPYAYFFQKLLQIQPNVAETFSIPAYEWGTLIHDILSRYHLKKKDDLPSKSLLHEISDKVWLTLSKDNIHWEAKKSLLYGSANQKGLWELYLNWEASHRLPFKPQFVRIPFKKIKITYQRKSMFLSGEIDMILGPNKENKVAVLDYKTGRTLPTKAKMKRFESLQLPIYYLAAQEKFPHTDVIGCYFMHMHHDVYFGEKLMLVTEKHLSEMTPLKHKPLVMQRHFKKDLSQHLVTLYSHILDGKFQAKDPLALPDFEKKRSQKCQTCSYHTLCRYEKRYGQ